MRIRFSSGNRIYVIGLVILAACGEPPTQPSHPLAAQLASGSYQVVDLGPGSAYAISASSEVAFVGEGLHVFLWKNGAVTDLGFFAPSLRQVVGINPRGQLVGWSVNQWQSYLLDNGTLTDLGAIPGSTAPRVQAAAMNAAGQVVGSELGRIGPCCATYHAFIWDNGTMKDLGNLGAPWAWATAVNSTGEVTGFGYTSQYYEHPFVWRDGVMTDLGSPLVPGLSDGDAEAYGINEAGQVVGCGTANASGGWHAMRWDRGTISDLGTLGGYYSCAYGINSGGLVVGMSFDTQSNTHAFLWDRGAMASLPEPPGSTGSWAFAVSPAGVITGMVQMVDGGHAVVWVPARLPQ